ncbi:MAG: chaperone modulator CbpM [Phycisphaerae bacterium]
MSPQSEPKTYTVQQAAETLGVGAADIETYVEEGLVASEGGTGDTMTFSRAQMRRLWTIVTLHRDLGVNLPGVAAVLQLREQFEQMRRDLSTLVEIVERELGPDVWDRLWPQDRPRPAADINIEDISERGDAEGGAAETRRPGGEETES